MCLMFACLVIVLQLCKECCVYHSDSNVCIPADRSLEGVISVGGVHLTAPVDFAQGYCTGGCAIHTSKKPANENR